ncbi:MAG: chromosomal replication initiator protein DnaA [Hyphomicrobiales bacterium]
MKMMQLGSAAEPEGAVRALEKDDIKEKWDRVAAKLRAELGEELFSSWFARMEAEEICDARLMVSVPTRFLQNWVRTHYYENLLKHADAEWDGIEAIVIKVRARGVPVKPRKADIFKDLPEANLEAPCNVRQERDQSARSVPNSASSSSERGSPLDHNLTFETFVIGGSNSLAHAAARRISEAQPGAPVSFNPLFVHAGAGLGKTHLLHAISWRIRQLHPARKVLYLTAERFMYHFLAALKARDVLPFKDYFQSVDVLLIDDFQFLQGKSMQQEFCHTFNSLVDMKRQVIIAADVPPAQLESIDGRMKSRLAGGLVVDIQSPDLELKRNILRTRLAGAAAKDPSIIIADEIVEFIAQRITGGGRELEGSLNRIIANQQLTRAALTVDQAALALRDLVRPSDIQRIKIDDILKVVGRHFNVPKADLLSPRRARSIVRPRQIGMYLAKTLTTRSLPEIGRRFGGRDHSTVLHAVRKIEELMQADEKMAREVSLLVRLLEQQ